MTEAIDIDGVRVVYEDSGGSGRPFVLVHGFTGNRHDFRDHYDALSEIGRTVIYDQRGHGESTDLGDPSAYRFDLLVRDLRALLRALEIDHCDLLGHSMGGMIALRYALAHPESVASLVLMDTSARMPDGFVRMVFAAGGELALREGMSRLAEVARSMSAGDPRRPAASVRFEQEVGTEAYWERHRQRMSAMDPAAFGALGTEMCDQESLTARLAEIACPTTIIVGDEDAPFVGPSAEMEAGIPGARRVVIDGAAHSPQLEQPQQWWSAIVDHLRWARATLT
jgi:pimeloyl-ACP methyl ester carboxylesterase